MPTWFDRLIDEPENAVQVYGPQDMPAGAGQMLLSNARVLGTERVVSDFTFGWCDGDADVLALYAPGNTLVWGDIRYLVVKALRESAVLTEHSPAKLQLLPLPYDALYFRNGAAMPWRLHLTFDVTFTLHSEDETPLDKVSIVVPAGTDLKENDQLIWDNWVWYVRAVEPGIFDGHEYSRKADVVRLGRPDGSVDYLFTNATLLRYRPNLTDPSPVSLRAKWLEPTHEKTTAAGFALPTHIYLPTGSDVLVGDFFSTVQLDRRTGVPQAVPGAWSVLAADEMGEPLPALRCEIEGGA